jgi:hypothetical protein
MKDSAVTVVPVLAASAAATGGEEKQRCKRNIFVPKQRNFFSTCGTENRKNSSVLLSPSSSSLTYPTDFMSLLLNFFMIVVTLRNA